MTLGTSRLITRSQALFRQETGPWEPYEYVVLEGMLLRVHRPKWHRTYRFSDGGVFKFWDLDDCCMAITFREKVDLWVSAPGDEPAWDIQDRVCFMLKSKEQDVLLKAMERDRMRVIPATHNHVVNWLGKHPRETVLT